MEEPYDWEKEVAEFESTKAGVKGLVDSGVTKVPRFFIGPQEILPSSGDRNVQIPVIDFKGIEEGGMRRSQIVNEIRKASETWGFFQMVNHGVPQDVMDNVQKSSLLFHEQPSEAKKGLYSSDGSRPVRFYSINGNFKKSDVAGWRDAFACTFPDDMVNPDAIPSVCRSEITAYVKYMILLKNVLSELLSEALGLDRDFLKRTKCMGSEYMTCLYYPACPEPEKALGTVAHADPTALTLLVQDSCGGLQVLYDGSWVDVTPIQGALIVNIGDFLQLMTNDKFKSVTHRVVSRRTGTRVASACFFFPGSKELMKTYGPIKELVSENNPAVYKEVSYIEFVTDYQRKVLHGGKVLTKLQLVRKE